MYCLVLCCAQPLSEIACIAIFIRTGQTYIKTCTLFVRTECVYGLRLCGAPMGGFPAACIIPCSPITPQGPR